MVDEALKALDGRFAEIYGEDGRRWIPPERLLRALLLQMSCTPGRSEELSGKEGNYGEEGTARGGRRQQPHRQLSQREAC
jgi:hypothetical protein